MKIRTIALLLAAVLVAASCGARLSDEQRAQGVNAGGGGVSGGAGGGFTAGGFSGGDASGGFTGGTDPLTGGSPDGSAGGLDPATGGATTGGADPASGGGTTDPAAGGGATGQTPAAGGGAPAAGAPCQSSGAADDTGVAADRIKLGNISDIGGPVPDLFKAAQQGFLAWVTYINANGGICGRGVEPALLDSQTNSGINNSVTKANCDKVFAYVGSMSAFDDGGAPVVDACGIPDLTAIPVNFSRMGAKNTYSPSPLQQGEQAVGAPNWVTREFPDAVKSAALFYLDAGVTKGIAEERNKAFPAAAGWTFKIFQPVGITEANYLPFVNQMKSQNIETVHWLGDIGGVVRLQKAMRQQSFEPAVEFFDSVVYAPGYLKQAGPAAEGTLFFLGTSMFEDLAAGISNPELSLYIEWLQKASPGASPDYFGLYAWSAGRLFERAAKNAGGTLTRAALFAELKKIKKWSGNGIHVEVNVGDKVNNPCYLIAEVSGGTFKRKFPAKGHDCTDVGPWRA